MPILNTDTQFGSVARFFHWVVALFVVAALLLGFFMVDATASFTDILYGLHKSLGLTILFLMVLRYLWRLVNRTPKFPAGTPVWQAKAAKWSHVLIYTFLFIQPLTGWLMTSSSGYTPNFWWLVKLPMPGIAANQTVAEIAKYVHIYCAWVLVGLLCLHALAAFEHLIIRRDGVWQSMTPKLFKKKTYYDQED